MRVDAAARVDACVATLDFEVMRIGVPTETAPGERRVALVPDGVRRLVDAGAEVLVESGAGERAAFPDALYAEAGARLASRD